MKTILILLLLTSCITVNIYEAQPLEEPKEIQWWFPDYHYSPTPKIVPFDYDSIIIGDGTEWNDTIIWGDSSGDTLSIDTNIYWTK